MKLQLKNKLGGGVSKAVAGQAVNYATRQYVGENKAVDVRLGVALLRDARVALKTKALALLLGVGGIFLIDAVELPLEMLIATLLPLAGIGLNLVGDGVEYLVGSVLIAAAVLPRLAPRSLVDQVRSERSPAPVPVHAKR